MTPHDPWEPALTRREGRHRLTSVEITVTNRCNLRCRHCAVGEVLVQAAEPERIPLPLLLDRLDEATGLQTLSITGGEPSENLATLCRYVLPILKYARGRGLKTQLNTNLTFPLDRYQLIAPYIDVLHITWNYTGPADFHRIAWGHGREHVLPAASAKLFAQILANARALADAGHFLSAETMINGDTAPHLGALNRMVRAMGCRRHEVHPMYPADWAADLPILPKAAFRAAVDRFLDERDPGLWVLFGTFPFTACSPDPADRAVLAKARRAPNLSIRNDPDGRNRLNINGFTGAITVTDFADFPVLGNLATDGLDAAFGRWQAHPAFAPYNCYCPEAGCTGPSPLVARMYEPGVDFRTRRAFLNDEQEAAAPGAKASLN